MADSKGSSIQKGTPTVDPRRAIKVLAIILVGCFVIYWLTSSSVTLSVTATLMITYVGLVLWITELIPFSLSCILILVLYVFANVADVDLVLSGFASGAVFLITGGMMIAQGVHSTPLGQRVVYYFLRLTSYTYRSLLFGIILIPQILSIFIPATGVRTALILPIIVSLISLLHLEKNENQKKQMMLAVAYGGSISGIGFLPAAIGNILVVEILYIYTEQTISYFDWLMYTFPIWLLCIPVTWFVVMKSFRGDNLDIGNVHGELDKKINDLGPITATEKRCFAILVLTVVLWATQGIHGLHPAIPALFAVVLMGLPFIGVAPWEKLAKIDLNTFLLVGATLSIGRVLVNTGSIDYLASSLFTEGFLSLMIHPLIVILFVTVLVQVFHLAVSNVSTAVVTVIPVVITLANQLGLDPVMISIAAGIACLLGFILIVETIPNVLAYSTGHIKQKDFFKPGITLTIYTALIVVIVAATWWKWLGLY